MAAIISSSIIPRETVLLIDPSDFSIFLIGYGFQISKILKSKKFKIMETGVVKLKL